MAEEDRAVLTERHTLRDYQVRAVEAVVANILNRPILVAPTGSGKTTMAVEIVERLGGRALWLAHRKELIEQAAARLAAHGLRAGIIMAGLPADPDAAVQVASVQTLARRAAPIADVLVIDECHHAAASTYQSILTQCHGVPLVGLTATPFRLDGRGLGDLFGEIVVAAWADELCAAGVLHQPRVWASKPPDLRNVGVVGGDYKLDAVADRINKAEINADIVGAWKKHASGKRTVAFAVNLDHSRAIADAFRSAGVPAEHLDGSIAADERKGILARLAGGQTHVVANCMILTEGWDLPALECAIIARPTASLNLHVQMIGRVMRACDGKDGAIVLDHAGNHYVHGLVTRRLNYSLGNEKVGFAEPLGLRRCKRCFLLFDLSMRCCPECGWSPDAERAERQAYPPVHGHGELEEFFDHSFEERRLFWNHIEAQRTACGYRPGWSFYRFRELFGVAPVVLDGELIDPRAATREQKRRVYRELVEKARERGYARGWAAHRYRDAFGRWPRFPKCLS